MNQSASLSQHHAHLIAASAISEEVADARGYRTVTTKTELRRLGFSDRQRCVPSLLLPVHSVTGETPFYQIRPDQPRFVKGKALKYETPAGARMAVDVPPACRSRLDDPSTPLFVTEGIRKADALASLGVCAIDLIGVWNFRGTNERGGKTLLADFESIALNDRTIYVVFDSDAMVKHQVQAACVRLAEVMKSRGANVLFIVLPAMTDGDKQGVDDFIAAGHGIDGIVQRARRDLPNIEGDDGDAPYFEQNGGLYWRKRSRDGDVEIPLTNFSARITADVLRDDGVDVYRSFEMEATLGERVRRFQIPAAQFASIGWATEHLGATAIVYPGFGIRDHARTAIQVLSGDVQSRQVYAHTGWREIDGARCYLHAGGAIGACGVVEEIGVKLPAGLEGFDLSTSRSDLDLRTAVCASLSLLTIAPARIIYPLLAAVYRAAAGPVDISIHVVGATGEGKSELAALIQQHFGPTMTARKLPGSWDSTANALEALTFAAKDAVFVVDDFMPNARGNDAHRLHSDADRLLRAKGNQSGRQRMRADTTLRPAKPPRSLILSTGEDTPRGQSLRARMLILELAPGDLNWSQLSDCQREAGTGLYTASLAGFVQWLAKHYPDTTGTKDLAHDDTLSLREMATGSALHRRTPETIANLAAGFRLFLNFAVDVNALTSDEADHHWREAWGALGLAAQAQSVHQTAGEPASRFLELVGAALVSGRSHVAAPDGGAPENAAAWGWRLSVTGTGDYQREEWRPQGDRIGWVDTDALLLDRDASHASARQLAVDSGDAFNTTRDTLAKRLHERGYLVGTESQQGELSVRRTLNGKRRRVWHLSSSALFPADKSGQSGQHDGCEYRWPERRLDSRGAKAEFGQQFCDSDEESDQLGRIGRILTPGERIGVPDARNGHYDSRMRPRSDEDPALNSATKGAGSPHPTHSNFCAVCRRLLPNAAARARGLCTSCDPEGMAEQQICRLCRATTASPGMSLCTGCLGSM